MNDCDLLFNLMAIPPRSCIRAGCYKPQMLLRTHISSFSVITSPPLRTSRCDPGFRHTSLCIGHSFSNSRASSSSYPRSPTVQFNHPYANPIFSCLLVTLPSFSVTSRNNIGSCSQVHHILIDSCMQVFKPIQSTYRLGDSFSGCSRKCSFLYLKILTWPTCMCLTVSLMLFWIQALRLRCSPTVC
jgi:hypothetical protein